jgi:perosamine synthetase
MFIPYGRQWIDDNDIKAVSDVLRSDFLTTGPKVEEFEKTIADYVGAKYAVAVSNGTAALHVACLAVGVKPGDEVITTPLTFAASANCVLYCGGTPVFADVDSKTYNIDPEDIEKKITSRTKGIIPVHFTGQPCDMDAIHAIAKKYNLWVLEDAAHALGAEYKGKKIGALSDMTEFSFHPVKHITTGEGGMVTTNNSELYERLKLFHTHGITHDANQMTHNEGAWYYEQLELGYNYRITDFQCALGISQMKKLPMFLKRRREIAAQYDEAFKNCKAITVPYQAPFAKNAYHIYIIQVKNMPRKEAYDKLKAAGLGVNVHYVPTYKFPYYQEHGYENVHCPNAENIYSKCITIPLFAKMTDTEVEYVIEQVLKLS